MDAVDIEAIKARCEAANSGPWFAVVDDCIGGTAVATADCPTSTLRLEGGREVANFMFHVDAEFIAHAREDIPALIAEVERLRAALGI